MNLDIEKIKALHKAGWTEDMIAFELMCDVKDIEWVLYLLEINDEERSM